MTVFYSFLHTTVHTGAPTHDGLGRTALVRRFKRVLNRRTRVGILGYPKPQGAAEVEEPARGGGEGGCSPTRELRGPITIDL
jgi:hypothetical protein